jgi:glucosamine-6-phosphate deaminase
VNVFDRPEAAGEAAGREAGGIVREAIAQRGQASIVLAAAASQLDMLRTLAAQQLDWSCVTMFHLDEYIGLPESHPASFRQFLQDRFISQVNLGAVHLLDADRRDPAEVCRQVGELIAAATVDLACIGIGENGHLAFNDPPADFETREPFIVVGLDEACRRQQVGEGWFEHLGAVPKQAISMSINEILRARSLVCTCPDARKAEPVRAALEGPVTPELPASILRRHPDCRIYLDRASASLL